MKATTIYPEFLIQLAVALVSKLRQKGALGALARPWERAPRGIRSDQI
jgi:hypothetical protein